MTIRVEGINKRFGEYQALADVTLDFPTGKLVALLGPSGCGKTTLLRVIAGLETADSGRVLLNGEDTSNTHVRDRRVGFVFQHYALFRHMTVFDNIAFGLRMRRERGSPTEAEVRRKVGNLLELIQLQELGKRYPMQLSGGQRQRVALARALAVEPSVLLLDEPFGALDAKVRKDLRRWLRHLHQEIHVTSVFVTHDQEEALDIADQVVLMNAGRVEQRGDALSVYRQPETAFVFGFLGTANRFTGQMAGNLVVNEGQVIGPAENPAPEGTEVLAYARPHELQVVVNANDSSGLPAVVDRILPFGAAVRIELTPSPLGDGKPGEYQIEMSPEVVAGLELREGQTVRVAASRLRVFPQLSA